MATNFTEKGIQMNLPTKSGASSEDPYVVGDMIPVVLLTDAETASPYMAACQLEGVFELSVKGHDGSTNVAIQQGDRVYFTDGRTPAIDADSSGKPFGIMMSINGVASGATSSVYVKLFPGEAAES